MEEDIDQWRENLEANLGAWRQEQRAKALERRAKEKLLAIAQARPLRAAKYKGVKNERGATIDFHDAGQNDLKLRLGQLEYELEVLEVLIETGEEELAGLPAPNEEAEKPTG